MGKSQTLQAENYIDISGRAEEAQNLTQIATSEKRQHLNHLQKLLPGQSCQQIL